MKETLDIDNEIAPNTLGTYNIMPNNNTYMYSLPDTASNVPSTPNPAPTYIILYPNSATPSVPNKVIAPKPAPCASPVVFNNLNAGNITSVPSTILAGTATQNESKDITPPTPKLNKKTSSVRNKKITDESSNSIISESSCNVPVISILSPKPGSSQAIIVSQIIPSPLKVPISNSSIHEVKSTSPEKIETVNKSNPYETTEVKSQQISKSPSSASSPAKSDISQRSFITLSPDLFKNLSGSSKLFKILPKVPGIDASNQEQNRVLRKRKSKLEGTNEPKAKRGRPLKPKKSVTNNLFQKGNELLTNNTKTFREISTKNENSMPSPLDQDSQSAMEIFSDILGCPLSVIQTPPLKSLLSSASQASGSNNRCRNSHVRALNFSSSSTPNKAHKPKSCSNTPSSKRNSPRSNHKPSPQKILYFENLDLRRSCHKVEKQTNMSESSHQELVASPKAIRSSPRIAERNSPSKSSKLLEPETDVTNTSPVSVFRRSTGPRKLSSSSDENEASYGIESSSFIENNDRLNSDNKFNGTAVGSESIGDFETVHPGTPFKTVHSPIPHEKIAEKPVLDPVITQIPLEPKKQKVKENANLPVGVKLPYKWKKSDITSYTVSIASKNSNKRKKKSITHLSPIPAGKATVVQSLNVLSSISSSEVTLPLQTNISDSNLKISTTNEEKIPETSNELSNENDGDMCMEVQNEIVVPSGSPLKNLQNKSISPSSPPKVRLESQKSFEDGQNELQKITNFINDELKHNSKQDESSVPGVMSNSFDEITIPETPGKDLMQSELHEISVLQHSEQKLKEVHLSTEAKANISKNKKFQDSLNLEIAETLASMSDRSNSMFEENSVITTPGKIFMDVKPSNNILSSLPLDDLLDLVYTEE